MKVGSLFSGIGGFDLGLERAGMEIVWQVENNPFCNKVLEKHWPNVKRYGDIKNVTNPEPVDLICGGFPCQPYSCAGKRLGAEDDRALWPEMFRIIQEARPRWVIGENVAGFINMGLDQSISDLEREGYSVQAFIVPACAVNAPHKRDRVWIIANSKESERKQSNGTWTWRQGFTNNNINAPDPCNQRLQGSERHGTYEQEQAAYGSTAECNHAWSEPWIEAAQRLCKLDARLSIGLDGCLTYPATHGIMGFILTLRRFHYATSEEIRAREILPILQQAFAEETVQRCFGRLSEVFEAEDLWCPVHGEVNGKREKDTGGISEGSTEISRNLLREMRHGQGLEHPPQERNMVGRCTCEFDDIVHELSHEIALGEWQNNAEKAENILFNLWEKSRGKRFLHEPLSALHEIWRSVTDKEIGAFRRHLDKRNKNRVQKLKALGNAVVPQVVEIMGRAIMEIENG